MHISIDPLLITMLELDTFWVSIYRGLGDHSLAAMCWACAVGENSRGRATMSSYGTPYSLLVHIKQGRAGTASYKTAPFRPSSIFSLPSPHRTVFFFASANTGTTPVLKSPERTYQQTLLKKKKPLANTQMAPPRDQRVDLRQLRKGK